MMLQRGILESVPLSPGMCMEERGALESGHMSEQTPGPGFRPDVCSTGAEGSWPSGAGVSRQFVSVHFLYALQTKLSPLKGRLIHNSSGVQAHPSMINHEIPVLKSCKNCARASLPSNPVFRVIVTLIYGAQPQCDLCL